MNIYSEEEESQINEKLFDTLFHHYRYNHSNSNLKNVLNHSCFSFRRYCDETFDRIGRNVNIKHELSCLIAACQSGKAHVTIPAMFLALTLEFSPILICCNSTLKEQFATRIANEAKRLFDNLGIPITPKLNKMFFEPLYLEPNSEGIFTEELLESLYHNQLCPRIIILLKHHKHVETVVRVLDDNINNNYPSPRIWMFFDEYQLTGVIKEESETLEEAKVKYDFQINALRKYVTREIGITATAEDIYLIKKVPMKNICFLKPSEYYRGVGWTVTLTETISSIKFQETLTNKSREGANFALNNIDGIQDVITDFKNGKSIDVGRIVNDIIMPQNPYIRTNFRQSEALPEKDEHPVIALIMVERQKKEHQLQTEVFLNNNKDITAFAQIIFNGDKISIVAENVSEDMTVKRENGQIVTLSKRNSIFGKFSKNSAYTDKRIVTFLKNTISIQDAIEWLGNFNSSDPKFRSPIKRIGIIAYDMTNCGISMVSHYFSNLNYHLTMMLLLTRNLDATVSNQRANRLSGNHGDDIGLTLITTSDIHEMLMKSRGRNDEIERYITECQKNPLTREEIISTNLAEQEVFDNRIHPRYHKQKFNNKKYKKRRVNPNAAVENEMLRSSPTIESSAQVYGNDMSFVNQQFRQAKEKKARLVNVEAERHFPETSPMEEAYKAMNVASSSSSNVASSSDSNPRKRRRLSSGIENDNSNEDAIKQSLLEVGEVEFERLTKKMFPKWSKELDSKISNFMKELDPNKNYSEKELKELLEPYFGSDNINKFLEYNIGKSRGFGKILYKTRIHTYHLHLCLVESYNKYF